MKLSVVIVNYNVKYFLENCLNSVFVASRNLDVEIIVVDNASLDGSDTMVRQKYPTVNYIYLENNIGFSKANNVGIKASSGEFILLLNPDTVVQENSFSSCVSYLEKHPEVGGLGVKMIDGSGTFLPESKRGLPTPLVAFYKVFGLSSLFPNSRRFGTYHLGYLDKNETHEVDVLSGAYLMMPRNVVDKVGMLDEDYFMYGEDIDLSYCITKAGYSNSYFAGTTIIHYKGESTKKNSVNYVFVFYRAMIIFAKKHFEKGSASMFSAFINVAIYFRAFIAVLRRLIGRHWQLILDVTVTFLAFSIAKTYYAQYAHKNFTDPVIDQLIPSFSILFGCVVSLSGSHDQPFKWNRLLKGWFAGSLMLLTVYALLPETFRFSRAVLLIGSLGTLFLAAGWRYIVSKFKSESFQIGDPFPSRRLVIGNESSLQNLKDLLEQTQLSSTFLAGISILSSKPAGFIGTLDKLPRACEEFEIQELVIDPVACGYERTIKIVEDSKLWDVDVKVLNEHWLIGPQQIVKKHNYAKANVLYSISYDRVKRQKFISDVLLSLLILTTFPLSVWFVDRKMGLVKNWLWVLTNKRSWVGYDQRGSNLDLPKLKEAPLHPNQNIIWTPSQQEQAFDGNIMYISSSIIWTDLGLAIKNIHHLGD